jgi:hypothetical protein
MLFLLVKFIKLSDKEVQKQEMPVSCDTDTMNRKPNCKVSESVPVPVFRKSYVLENYGVPTSGKKRQEKEMRRRK